jgi:hypothetical protein
MQPKQKRIKRYADGFYYPERKMLFFWVPYGIEKCFRTLDNARNFLDKQHARELHQIHKAQAIEIFEWKPEE